MNLIMWTRNDGFGRIRMTIFGLWFFGCILGYIFNVVELLSNDEPFSKPCTYCLVPVEKFNSDVLMIAMLIVFGIVAWIITGLLGWIWRGFFEKGGAQ